MICTWKDTNDVQDHVVIETRIHDQRYIGESVLHCQILDHDRAQSLVLERDCPMATVSNRYGIQLHPAVWANRTGAACAGNRTIDRDGTARDPCVIERVRCD